MIKVQQSNGRTCHGQNSGVRLMSLRCAYKTGWTTAVQQMGNKDYGHTVLPITKGARNFYRGLKEEGLV